MIDNSHFVKYVADTGTDLSQHLLIDRLCTLKLDPREFENFANKHRDEATVKWYHPRPFLNAETNTQAINANWIGYKDIHCLCTMTVKKVLKDCTVKRIVLDSL